MKKLYAAILLFGLLASPTYGASIPIDPVTSGDIKIWGKTVSDWATAIDLTGAAFGRTSLLTSSNIPKIDILDASRCGVDAGANDTYVATLSPAITAYISTPPTLYCFKANTANTGAATINLNSVGAKTIKKTAGGVTTDLADNDIRAGAIIYVSYDGTNMQCLNCGGNAPTVAVPGSDTQFIFNDSAAFGADSGATFDKATNVATFLGGTVSGDCTTNCLVHDTSAVTGTKTATWPNTSGTVQYQTVRAYWDGGAMTTDGTQCADPSKQTLNSGPTVYTFSCADNNGSIFYGQITLPYAVTTATFKLDLFHGTTETITFAGDFSAQCRAAGTAVNGTWGTGVAADVAITTANQVASATTTAVTPNGSCAAGATLFWRYVVDAANFSANSANAKIIGVFMDKAS